MLKKYVGVFLLLFAVVNLNAAENNTTSKASSKNEQQIQNSKEDALKAAQELLKAMNLKEFYKNAVNNSTKRLVEANPAFKSVEGKIKAFYEKYIGWDAMKDDLAKLYAKYFNAKELKDIAAFYKTPTGKKVLQKMPKLSMEGQLLTQSRLRPHLEELKKLLDSTIKNAQKTTPPKKSKKVAKSESEHTKK